MRYIGKYFKSGSSVLKVLKGDKRGFYLTLSDRNTNLGCTMSARRACIWGIECIKNHRLGCFDRRGFKAFKYKEIPKLKGLLEVGE